MKGSTLIFSCISGILIGNESFALIIRLLCSNFIIKNADFIRSYCEGEAENTIYYLLYLLATIARLSLALRVYPFVA